MLAISTNRDIHIIAFIILQEQNRLGESWLMRGYIQQ